MQPPKNTNFETIRTIASVVSAVCLIAITIEMLIAGVVASQTVHHLHSTYHPERIGSIIGNASDILNTVHQTTHTLQNGTKIAIFEELDKIAGSMQSLAAALDKLHVDDVILEASSWRSMSTQAIQNLKKTLGEL